MIDMQPILSVKDLTVEYLSSRGERTRALSSFSCDVAPGEIVAVVGESGSGKSTVASAIMGILPASAKVSGSIVIRRGSETHDVVSAKERERDTVRRTCTGMIFQDPGQSFNPVYRIAAQLLERLPAGLSKDERAARIRTMLSDCGIDDAQRVARSYPHQLSGGMAQRAMIAQALLSDPSLLIADEATSSLDVTVQAQVMALLAAAVATRTMSMLFITHDIALAAAYAHRIVVLRHGQCAEDGPAKTVISHPAHEYTRQLLGSVRLCLR